MIIPVEQLGWMVGTHDVTCRNCHSAIYKPDPDEHLCPLCRYALGEDLMAIHASLSNILQFVRTSA